MARSLVPVAALMLLAGCAGSGGTPRTYPLTQGEFAPSQTRAQSPSRAVPQTNCLAWPGGSGILPDGDFSQANDPGGGLTFGAGQGFAPNWTVTTRTIDFYGAADRFWREPNNVCSVDLDGSPGAGGIVHQPFPTTIGANYTVSFILSGNGEGTRHRDGTCKPVVKTLLVKAADQSTEFQWDTTGENDAEDGVFQQESWNFTAVREHTTLAFVSLDRPPEHRWCGPIVAAISVTKN